MQSPTIDAFRKTGVSLLSRLGDSPTKSPANVEKSAKKRCHVCPYWINASKFKFAINVNNVFAQMLYVLNVISSKKLNKFSYR